ncbi:cornifelin homolog [Girardinichthys multiradiatus]|uniref:cornifelin homolog n=1 Tax=Girardinichthys multiradiatus TaxID=208333 RepID=UPI001FABECFC|nr:cornifelin homolog [Girardinichthys multiradiatus]
MATNMVVEQPQLAQVVQNSQEWGTGIFDCLDDLRSCCFAYWCFPCFACMTSRDFGEPLCLPLLDVFGGLIPPITLAIRVSMRHRYGIQGSIPLDCVFSTFCGICSWCQMSREIKRRKLPVVVITTKNA